MYSEEELEEGTLDWFEEIGYNTAFGPDISPDDFDFFSKAIVSELPKFSQESLALELGRG